MAEKKKKALLIDQDKINTLNRLKEHGFDTANKIKALDGREMFNLGLMDVMGNIYELQDAIKANHGEIGWILDGEDPKPAKKEVSADENENSGYGLKSTDGYNY